MNGTRNTEWLLPATAGVALGGTLALEPLLGLAAALAALCAAGRRLPEAFATAGAATSHDPARPVREAVSGLVFRGFKGGEVPSSASGSGWTSGEEKKASDGNRNRGSQSYEEFAAGLDEDEEEEISFIPPYASDTVDSAGSGDGSRGESLLKEDLRKIEEMSSKLPIPRRFALGTVAIIRRLLEPGQVEQILLEQRRYPRLRFGDVAVQLGLLSESEVQELLVAQEQGLFSDEEISDARRRLATYHSGGAAP